MKHGALDQDNISALSFWFFEGLQTVRAISYSVLNRAQMGEHHLGGDIRVCLPCLDLLLSVRPHIRLPPNR